MGVDMSDGDFLWKLIAVLSNVMCLVTMLFSLRRSPPISEELYKDFATKEALNELKTHNSAVHKELFELTRQMQKAHSEDLKTIERAVGKLEGVIGELKKP